MHGGGPRFPLPHLLMDVASTAGRPFGKSGEEPVATSITAALLMTGVSVEAKACAGTVALTLLPLLMAPVTTASACGARAKKSTFMVLAAGLTVALRTAGGSMIPRVRRGAGVVRVATTTTSLWTWPLMQADGRRGE